MSTSDFGSGLFSADAADTDSPNKEESAIAPAAEETEAVDPGATETDAEDEKPAKPRRARRQSTKETSPVDDPADEVKAEPEARDFGLGLINPSEADKGEPVGAAREEGQSSGEADDVSERGGERSSSDRPPRRESRGRGQRSGRGNLDRGERDSEVRGRGHGGSGRSEPEDRGDRSDSEDRGGRARSEHEDRGGRGRGERDERGDRSRGGRGGDRDDRGDRGGRSRGGRGRGRVDREERGSHERERPERQEHIPAATPRPLARMAANTQRVAVFLDYESLEASAEEAFGGFISSRAILSKVLGGRQNPRALAYIGKDSRSRKSALEGAGFDWITAEEDRGQRMLQLAMDAIAISTRVDTIVIGSSDPGISPLVTHLQNSGLRVEIACFSDASRELGKISRSEIIELGRESTVIP